MTSKLYFRDGDSEVVMDDTIGDMVRGILADKLGPVVRALDWHLSRVEGNIERNWPVKSGFSRRSFGRRTAVVSGGTVSIGISNTAEYVYFVKGKHQGGKQSIKLVVWDYAKSIEDELVAIAGDEILKAMGF